MNENMKKAWKSFKEMVEKAKIVEKISMDAEFKDVLPDPEDSWWVRHEKTGRITLTVVINNK